GPRMSRPLHDPGASINFTAHPPERRRRRSSVIAAQACCCCCCCCCLHAVGGLVGALVGTLVRVQPSPRQIDPDAELPFRRDEEDPVFVLPVSIVYWSVFSLVSLVSFGVSAYNSGSGGVPSNNDLILAGIIILLFLPLVQLGASVLALIV